jgi:hypothetical protein
MLYATRNNKKEYAVIEEELKGDIGNQKIKE